MPFVITSACIDVKEASCVQVCPVDCIYVGGRMLYIHPTECINCGACVPVCPVNAIYFDEELPAEEEYFLTVNEEFFRPAVTGWASPRGATNVGPTDVDHPAVAAFAVAGEGDGPAGSSTD